ncbi:MAG: hypothetical protein WBB06_04630 [Chitinophagaceae bacterium]
MNPRINQLVKSLLLKDSIEQCSIQELQQFADRHPFFGAAQLLLTKKLQTENPEQYEEQLQKTFLFFHNPLWVEHLLNDTGNASVMASVAKKETPVIAEIPVEMIRPTLDVTEIAEMGNLIPETNSKEETVETQVIETPEPVLDIPSLKMDSEDSQNEDPAKNDLVFEPFHTVDYFASQGIKFKEEEKPIDKFGQQLKSFTDWLKTMKRLPVSEISKAVETPEDQKVEILAEHSIEDREVLTEAMAEVWEKQGNEDKAIEVYTKLSLLDPSKSLYFASKIDRLKKIN